MCNIIIINDNGILMINTIRKQLFRDGCMCIYRLTILFHFPRTDTPRKLWTRNLERIKQNKYVNKHPIFMNFQLEILIVFNWTVHTGFHAIVFCFSFKNKFHRFLFYFLFFYIHPTTKLNVITRLCCNTLLSIKSTS